MNTRPTWHVVLVPEYDSVGCPECPRMRPCVKHSVGGGLIQPIARTRAIRHPFFDTPRSAPNTRRLGRPGATGQIWAGNASSTPRFYGTRAKRLRKPDAEGGRHAGMVRAVSLNGLLADGKREIQIWIWTSGKWETSGRIVLTSSKSQPLDSAENEETHENRSTVRRLGSR